MLVATFKILIRDLNVRGLPCPDRARLVLHTMYGVLYYTCISTGGEKNCTLWHHTAWVKILALPLCELRHLTYSF